MSTASIEAEIRRLSRKLDKHIRAKRIHEVELEQTRRQWIDARVRLSIAQKAEAKESA